ncbi:MAG: hypothetical protein AAF491_02320 [Verrucomicrobiota bacterium]
MRRNGFALVFYLSVITLSLAFPTVFASNVDLSVEEKLKQIILPKVDFEAKPLSKCLEILEERSRELDPSPINKGLSIIDHTDGSEDILISLRLTNVPLHEAIRYACQLANRNPSYDDRGVHVRMVEENPSSEVSEYSTVLEAKLESIIIPDIDFVDTPLRDALSFLQQKSMELDPETDPDKKGINLILEKGPSDPEPKITLKLTRISLKEAFEYIASLSGLECQLTPDYLLLKPEK